MYCIQEEIFLNEKTTKKRMKTLCNSVNLHKKTWVLVFNNFNIALPSYVICKTHLNFCNEFL